MADTPVTANPGSGGAAFAADKDGSNTYWPYAKLAWGTSGAQTEVSKANPLPVAAQPPYVGTPQGYSQYTSLGSAVGLSPPGSATFCVVSVGGAAIRWRDDGTAPTGTTGMPIASGGYLLYSASLSAIQFIQQTGTASLDVNFYS